MPLIPHNGTTESTELRLEISIPYAVAGSTISVLRNGTVLGNASFTSSTTYEYTDTSVPLGTHTYTARITLGTSNATSTAYIVTVIVEEVDNAIVITQVEDSDPNF